MPKASIAKTSQSFANFLLKSSSLAFSPILKRTFSQSTTSPDLTSTPSSQFFSNLTSLPNNLLSLSATGLSENSSSNSPSVGLPRWDIIIIAAPFSRAISIVGTDAFMRLSLVTTPFLIGTFKS